MIVNTVAKSVDLRKVIRQRKVGVLLAEVRNDFVDGGRNLLKERVVDVFKVAVERKLTNS